jgi:hypothetical protein
MVTGVISNDFPLLPHPQVKRSWAAEQSPAVESTGTDRRVIPRKSPTVSSLCHLCRPVAKPAPVSRRLVGSRS